MTMSAGLVANLSMGDFSGSMGDMVGILCVIQCHPKENGVWGAVNDINDN